MAESLFQLLGTYSAEPLVPAPSFAPAVGTSFDTRVQLSKKHVDELSLSADPFQAVSLGGLSGVNVLIVSIPGGRATLRVTSAAGSQQLLPVEELLILCSFTVPLTAIDVQRVAGVATEVQVFLGQR